MTITNTDVKSDRPTQKVILNQSLIIINPTDVVKDKVIRANTFRNPKYESTEKLGYSTWNIEPFVYTYTSRGNALVVSRGFAREFMDILNKNDIECLLEDKRTCPHCEYPPLAGITLRSYQQKAVDESANKGQGVLVATTGAGKTIMGLELIRRRKTTALIIVHKKELAAQWSKEIKRLFGFEPGIIGDGKFEIGERITIAMAQTLAKREEQCKELVRSWGLILVDECHHAPADQFSTVINWMPARYRYGLSATPTRRDGLDCIIFRTIGPIIAQVPKAEVVAKGSVIAAKVNIVRTEFNPGIVNNWHEYLNAINCAERNMLIIGLIPKDKSTLILVDRVIHAEDLSSILRNLGIDHILAHGTLPTEERSTLMQRIKHSSLTVGTCGLLGEGLDVAHWDTLIMASPISSEVKLMQAVGRIVRPAKDKDVAIVYDLHDDSGLSGSSLKKRIELYKKHGIRFDFNWETQTEKCA